MDAEALGAFLRDRRHGLDPAAFGIAAGRRRTPGLRREEVAQRAAISTTWYTWLEQGRGGAASPQVLDRIATALMFTDTEREHAFILGLGRLPEVRRSESHVIDLRLQRVLDAFETAAAFIRSASWDVLAFNQAATVILRQYGASVATETNLLRQIFLNPASKTLYPDWENVARHMVSVFRADMVRADSSDTSKALVQDLLAASPDFAAIWSETAVADLGDGIKTMHHPVLGSLELEVSSFAVSGCPDLTMMVYCAVAEQDLLRIRRLIADRPGS